MLVDLEPQLAAVGAAVEAARLDPARPPAPLSGGGHAAFSPGGCCSARGSTGSGDRPDGPPPPPATTGPADAEGQMVRLASTGAGPCARSAPAAACGVGVAAALLSATPAAPASPTATATALAAPAAAGAGLALTGSGLRTGRQSLQGSALGLYYLAGHCRASSSGLLAADSRHRHHQLDRPHSQHLLDGSHTHRHGLLAVDSSWPAGFLEVHRQLQQHKSKHAALLRMALSAAAASPTAVPMAVPAGAPTLAHAQPRVAEPADGGAQHVPRAQPQHVPWCLSRCTTGGLSAPASPAAPSAAAPSALQLLLQARHSAPPMLSRQPASSRLSALAVHHECEEKGEDGTGNGTHDGSCDGAGDSDSDSTGDGDGTPSAAALHQKLFCRPFALDLDHTTRAPQVVSGSLHARADGDLARVMCACMLMYCILCGSE
jgi:hypothetical protein